MKAAILEKYASDGIAPVIRDIPVPAVSDDEVLVRIKAAGVNPLDNMIVRGEVKLIVPYRFPLVMGNEFSGVVCQTARSQSVWVCRSSSVLCSALSAKSTTSSQPSAAVSMIIFLSVRTAPDCAKSPTYFPKSACKPLWMKYSLSMTLTRRCERLLWEGQEGRPSFVYSRTYVGYFKRMNQSKDEKAMVRT